MPNYSQETSISVSNFESIRLIGHLLNISRTIETGQQLEEPDSPWLHYLLLRAVNKFHTENGSYPGYYDDNVETDIAKLKVMLAATIWSRRSLIITILLFVP